MTLRLNVMKRHALATGAVVVLLSACGGGNEIFPTVDTPPATVPPSATASPQAYTVFAASLAPTETGASLRLGEFEAPTTETGEPLPLD